jgi:lipopolysaccharide/colanic/teichoic acid biosynthesis glycosyltransferase
MPVLIQRAFALLTIVVMGPLLGALAAAVRLGSPGPALHRARRVGPDGEFTLYKFRTMTVGAEAAGPGITAAGDPRVTRLGRVLRGTKLDELPQLWNVVRGEMLVVGPRPEDPRYVDRADPLHALVFAARPGITGPTALAYRHEERLLAEAASDVARADGRSEPTAADVERAYRERILPRKLELDAAYLRSRSATGDLAILGRTIGQVLRGTGGR